MNRKSFSAFLSVAVLLAIGGQVSARRVTHPVTPKNINEQPFSFTVNVKDVGNVKEFEVLVKSKGRGHPAPVPSAYGKVVIQRCGKKPAAFPPVGRVEAKGMQKYTFRVSPADLDRARFTFTESPEGRPFPSPGDYWAFDLSDFVSSSKK